MTKLKRPDPPTDSYSRHIGRLETVSTIFSSVETAYKAAVDQRAQVMREAYAAGVPVATIATATGISKQAVYAILGRG